MHPARTQPALCTGRTGTLRGLPSARDAGHRAQGRTDPAARPFAPTDAKPQTAQAAVLSGAGKARLVPTACAAARSELRGNAPRGTPGSAGRGLAPHTTRLPTGLGSLFPGEGPLV